jgi:parallel beta-helix repeat protein
MRSMRNPAPARMCSGIARAKTLAHERSSDLQFVFAPRTFGHSLPMCAPEVVMEFTRSSIGAHEYPFAATRITDRTPAFSMARTATTPAGDSRLIKASAVPARHDRRRRRTLPGINTATPRSQRARSWRIGASVAFIFLNAACGGGGDNSESGAGDPITAGVDLGDTNAPPTTPPTASPTAPPAAAAAAYRYCTRVPLAARQAGQHQVRDFGAVPDDDRDDTDAIQRALDAMKPGETLVFSPGRYLISRTVRVRQPGVTVTGPKAIIHATNPDSQALLIEADNTTVSSLTFTAVTQGRRSAAWHSRIVVAADTGGGNYRTVYNTVIRDNGILGVGNPGTPTANSSSAGGILLMRANGFLITGNTITRTLADGIHVTAGSKNGRVLNNAVRETGDDMIAVVSYLGTGNPVLNNAPSVLAGWNARVDSSLVRNVLIAGNQLSGQYWGRGISVVGGQSVTIARNTLDNVPIAAGILIAREAGYQTFGVQNVLVEGNLIRDVQTLKPPYDFQNKFASASRTGHGAIEIHAALFDDEADDNMLRESLAVRDVLVRGNVVERASVSGVRAGVNMAQTLRATDAEGRSLERRTVSGLIRNIGVANNRFDQITGDALRVLSSDLLGAGVYCSANKRDGKDYQSDACKLASEPAVQGAPLNCSPEGALL